MRSFQAFKDWNRKRKLKILYDIAYVPEIRTYRMVRIRAAKASPDYIRVTGSKTEFIRYEGMHDIPEDDSMLTAMGLQRILDNRDIKRAFDQLTGAGASDALDPKKMIIYGVIFVVAAVFVYAFMSPMLS